jgi:hypothetical protein
LIQFIPFFKRLELWSLLYDTTSCVNTNDT